MRILLVEDDDRLAGLIAQALQKAGFALDCAIGVAQSETLLTVARFDAIILDLGLCDGNGMDLLFRLRRAGDGTPVLILSARDQLEDRVEGLNAGADDYLVKPFALAELKARINALLRRPGAALGRVLEAGNLRFDTVGRTASVEGLSVQLGHGELNLLELLLRRVDKVVPWRIIIEGLYDTNSEVTKNAVEAIVYRLRRRLNEAGANVTIHALKGVGYLLRESSSQMPTTASIRQ